MMIINQHICIFLAGSTLNGKQQQEFFYRMCTALGYDDDTMIKFSNIYSVYGLFQTKPLHKEDINRLKRLAPCKGCSALRRKSIYKNMSIYEKACPLCIFSENYKNARERDETIVLRYLMKPDTNYEYYQILSENAFTSLNRLCADYAIGDYPVIPFRLYLYRFLENNLYFQEKKDSFFENLLQFIMTQMDSVINIEKYREPLKILFDSIISIDEHAVNEDVYEISAAKLKQQYSYQPPIQLVKPVQSGYVGKKPRQRRNTINNKEPKNQLSLFQMVDIKNESGNDIDTYTDISVSPIDVSFKKNKSIETCPSENIFEKAEPENNSSNIKETELNTVSVSVQNDDIGIPDIETISNISYKEPINIEQCDFLPEQHTNEKTINVAIEPDTIIKESCIKEQQESSVKANIEHTCPMVNNKPNINDYSSNYKQLWYNYIINCDSDIYTNTTFSEDFLQKIEYLERKKSFKFVVMLEKNYNICMEPVKIYDREGILIYLPIGKQFFFYDIEIFGTDILTMYLAKPNIISITSNTLGILAMLISGFHCPDYIFGIDTAEWILNPTKKLDLKQIIEENTNNLYIDSDIAEPLEYAMPLYRKVYFSLKEHLKVNACTENYGKSMRILGVISRAFDLKQIFFTHKSYITSTGFMQFQYHFNWSDTLNRKGQMFRISVPCNLEFQNGIQPDSFLADILLCFCGLHHSNENRVYLVSISSSAIYYFFDGDYDASMHVYDSIIARIQKNYLERYKHPINTSTTFITYE